MKKSFKMMGMAAMVLLLAVSCKKENKEEAVGETKAMTFTAGISQGNGKTYLNDHNLLWSEGDVININNQTFQLTEGKGTSKGVFEGKAEEATTYYAVYPALGSLDGNTATITLPAVQPYVAGSFDKGIAPMVAMTDDSKSFTFTNVCGLLRLDFTNISKQFDKIVLESSNGEYLAGEGTVAITGDGNESLVLTNASSNSKTITMSTSGVTSDTDTKIVFVLPAGTLKHGFNVYFYAGDEQFDAVSTSADMEIEAGKMNIVTVDHVVNIQAATIHSDAVTTTSLEVPYEIKDACVSASIQCATDAEFTQNVKTKSIELPTSKSYANGSVTFEGLTEATLYHVRILVKTGDEPEETPYCTIVAETLGGGSQHEYVDLGLPSSTLWATCNLGADSPEECGYYFAWGETVKKDIYSWETYNKHTNGTYSSDNKKVFTKYVPTVHADYWNGSGDPDNKNQLDPEDDVVRKIWGGEWRMPSEEDWKELKNNTTQTWKAANAGITVGETEVTMPIAGCYFVGKGEFADKYVFLPAAGYGKDTSITSVGGSCFYWSSSRHLTNTPVTALSMHIMFFMSSLNVDPSAGGDRKWGFTVRAVQ